LLENCFATGSVNGTTYYIGGLVGYSNAGSIRNCYTNSTVTGGGWVGGILGNTASFGVITNVYAAGTVSGTECVGGIIGSGGATTQPNTPSGLVACGASADAGGDLKIGRVIGNRTSLLHAGYALETMTVNGLTINENDPTSVDGADITSADLLDPAFWASIGYGTDKWRIVQGEMPLLLANLAAQLPPATPVIWTGLTANGTSNATTTTELTLTFDVDPTTLTADDITVTGAAKGALTGTGTTRTLSISNITVANGESITVEIASPTGYAITPASSTVNVYKASSSGGGSSTTYYTVKFNTNGGNAVSDKSVAYGNTVTKPADPTRDGYTFTGWYTDEACTALYDFSVKVTKSFTLYAGWEKTETPVDSDLFDDISGHWAESYINSLGAHGYVNGTGNRMFSPNAPLTRAQFVQIIYNAFGNGDDSSPVVPFDDCDSGAWYAKALNWAYANGIINGYSSTMFGPGDHITREQMAVLIVRAAEKFEVTFPSTNDRKAFDDDSLIASYAKDAVYTMQQADIISGKPGNIFDPNGSATRGEMAKVMYFMLDYAGKIADEYKVV